MRARVATPEAYRLLHDGIIVLAEMEANGIKIDTEYLRSAIQKTEAQAEKLKDGLCKHEVWKTWRKAYGAKANLRSRAQLGDVLFSKLRFPYPGDSEGKYKTDDDTLREVDSDFVRSWTEMEKAFKIRSTFLGGIAKETVDGRLHPMFNLHLARTFRSSSDSPNFHNFPIRDPEVGKLVRSCFIARKGYHLVECDFGGIEVRIAACYHKDPTMITYINDPSKDMHRDMAAQCYKMRPEDVQKPHRYCGKNMFVFPQFYGDYYVDCARSMWKAIDTFHLTTPKGQSVRDHLRKKGITSLGSCDPAKRPTSGTFERHIFEVEQHFWNVRFPVYKKWKDTWWERYQRKGGFRTLTGFWIEGDYKRNDVINYPVQGSAFHCLLWSLIEINKRLKKNKMRSKLIGQIHDSVVAEAHRSELAEVLQIIKEVMTVALPKVWKWIIVPLEVEAEVAPLGGSWFEKKKVDL